MKKKQKIIIISIFGIVLLFGLIIGLFLLGRPQTTVNRATEPLCPANGATCSWDSDESATSFQVEIIDETTGETLLSTSTTNKAIQFTPLPNHTYKCNVTPVNICGEGTTATASNTCIPEVTNTPTPTESPTSTPTVVFCQQPSTCRPADQCSADGGTTNDEQCEEPGMICCIPSDTTPTPTPTETPTPTPTETPTPTPTATPIPTFTPAPTSTPYPTYTPYPSSTVGPTWTPAPTYTPQPTYTGFPSPTPTEIIIAVNNTSTPTPIAEGTAVPTIPAAGVPVAWYIVLIPLAMLSLGLLF